MFVCTGDGTIRTFKEVAGGSVPVKDKDFTYTGNCEVIDDSDDVSGVQWRIKFLTSGILTTNTDWIVDIFLVGGGSSGTAGIKSNSVSYSGIGGDGGAGGSCRTVKSLTITSNITNNIIIGNSNGTSSALGQSATTGGGGAGGSGGSGQFNDYIAAAPGNNGYSEFGEAGNTLYAGGGGGGGKGRNLTAPATPGANGGSGGGGTGGTSSYRVSGSGTNGVWHPGSAGSSGETNTGGGGGGGGCGGADGKSGYQGGSGGDGGSGIVIIRKHRDTITTIASASITQQSGVTYTDGLDGLSANEISLFSAAISNNSDITNETSVVYLDNGDIHRKVSVGDQVTLSLTLNGTNYAFDVIGFNHDTLTNTGAYGEETATGKAGITFQMHDLFATTYPMNSTSQNTGGWKSSAMRTSTMATMKSYLPDDWESIIKPVNKASSMGGNSTNGTETVSDSCFLLAEIEIFGSIENSVSGEGTQYAYYKAGNSKVKNKGGSANIWWERSHRSDYKGQFCNVSNTGRPSANYANDSYGVAFGFCV